MNENYVQPPMPTGAEEGILRGLYRVRTTGEPQGQADTSGVRQHAGMGRREGANEVEMATGIEHAPQAPIVGRSAGWDDGAPGHGGG